MKYYSEEDTKNLRLAFEEGVLRWPHVSTKKMFGCPCYQAKGKLFAFLVTKGVVITQLGQADREALSRQHKSTSFRAGKVTARNWLKLSVKNTKDLNGILPFVKRAYQSALRKP